MCWWSWEKAARLIELDQGGGLEGLEGLEGWEPSAMDPDARSRGAAERTVPPQQASGSSFVKTLIECLLNTEGRFGGRWEVWKVVSTRN